MAERADLNPSGDPTAPDIGANRPAPVVMPAPEHDEVSTVGHYADQITDQLQERWARLVQRFSQPFGSPHNSFPELLRDDAEFAIIRLKYYQQYYPLQMLGAVAAAAFLLGAVLALGRED